MSAEVALREYGAEARSSDVFGRVICRAREHHFVIDGPVHNGAPGEEVTPSEAFLAERCDGWTSDKSQLAAFQSEWPEDEGGPEALRILDETMSKEPLGPATLDGDSDWFDAVQWAVFATIQAEEWGISSATLDEFLNVDPAEEPAIAAFLGVTDFDPGLGLEPGFARNIIEQVGNYEEIWLLRGIGFDGVGPQYDGVYNAFLTPRNERTKLPLLGPAAARAYIAEVRGRGFDALETVEFDPARPFLRDACLYGMVVQHEHMHDETMLATLQLMEG